MYNYSHRSNVSSDDKGEVFNIITNNKIKDNFTFSTVELLKYHIESYNTRFIYSFDSNEFVNIILICTIHRLEQLEHIIKHKP
jgi:hypothetical protein